MPKVGEKVWLWYVNESTLGDGPRQVEATFSSELMDEHLYYYYADTGGYAWVSDEYGTLLEDGLYATEAEALKEALFLLDERYRDISHDILRLNKRYQELMSARPAEDGAEHPLR